MGRLIDLDIVEFLKVDGNKEFNHGVDCCINRLLEQPIVEAIPIPKDATNEDILKAVFPDDANDLIKYIKAAILNGWLYSKYKENEDATNSH